MINEVDIVDGVAVFEIDIDSSGDYLVVANGTGNNLNLSVGGYRTYR